MVVSACPPAIVPVNQPTHQCLHCAVQSMSVVAAELGVGTLERWVAVGLWLLDTVKTSTTVFRATIPTLRTRYGEP